MKKITPWTKIKAEYLQGCTPKELALKYKIKAKSISDKATKEKWTLEKSQICVNLLQNTEDRIKDLAQKALNTLEDVILNPDATDKDKVSAAKAILDVSGLKKDKHEMSGGVEVQRIFVTPEMHEATMKHIQEVINDQ